MRRSIMFVALAVSAAFAAVDLTKPIAELALKDGRNLKNVVLVAYSPSAVMAKWDGGRGTIPYEALPIEIAEAAKVMRPMPGKMTAPPPKPSPPVKSAQEAAAPRQEIPAVANSRTLVGQVFVTTRGAGAYKFSGATVLTFPAVIFDEVSRMQRVLGPGSSGGTRTPEYEAWETKAWIKALQDHSPCGSATTDAVGKYSMPVGCEGDVFVFCHTRRLVGRYEEHKLWVVMSTGDRTLNLDNTNSLF